MPGGRTARLCDHLSRRQLALIVIGAAWVAHGVTIAHNPGPMVHDQAIFVESWPLPLRVAIWVFAGFTAVVLSATGKKYAQARGWALAIAPPFIRLIAYTWSLLMWIVPGAPGGEPLSFAYVVWWGSLVVLVWWSSRWPEPEHHNGSGVSE